MVSVPHALDRVSIATRVSPLQPTPQLATRLGVGELLVKRDDLINAEFGGCKVRNLEVQIHRALVEEADTLVLSARAGSNAVAAAALFAPRFGLRVCALLKAQPDGPTARHNLALTSSAGAQVVPIEEEHSLKVTSARMQLEVQRLRRRGRPYLLPFGGGDVDAAAAHALAVFELRQQLTDLDRAMPDEIWITGASFATAAGVAAGIELARLPTRLVIVGVVDSTQYDDVDFRKKANAAAERLFGPDARPLRLEPERRMLRSALGPGYGHWSASSALADIAEYRALQLDEVYAARAFAVLTTECGLGGKERIVFWNTGNSRPWPTAITRAPIGPELAHLLLPSTPPTLVE